jgi:MFS family permease
MAPLMEGDRPVQTGANAISAPGNLATTDRQRMEERMAEGVVAAGSRRRFGWYYGWNILGLAVLAQMASVGLVINCFSLFLVDWSRDFHAPVSSFQLSMIVFAVVNTPLCAVAGGAVDRFSIRWLAPLGLMVVCLSEVAIGFSNSAGRVAATYAFNALGIAFSSSIVCQALVARWFVKRRGLALGISAFGKGMAAVIFPPIIGLLMRMFGWRETWWIFAGFTAVIVVPLVLLGVRDRPEPNDPSGYMTAASHQDTAQGPRLTYLQIISRANFWLIGLPFVMIFSAWMGVIANLAPLVKSHGMSAQIAVILLSAYGFSDLTGKLAAGALSDRFGARAPTMVLGLLGALAATGMAFAPAPAFVIAGVVAMGFTGGIWSLGASATAIEYGQQNFGRAYGLMSAFTPAGTLMPWVLARTQEWTGSYAPGFIGITVLLVAAAGLSMLLRERATSLHHDA